MNPPAPELLGALYAISAVLLLLVLLFVAALLALWGWLRGHERGELRWTKYGTELKVDSPPTILVEKQS